MRTGAMRVAEISLPAIRHNVRRVREVTGDGAVIAVVKANGYGHGAELAARAAIDGGAALLGVTDLEEALSLRAAGIDAPILCWLHGVRAEFDGAVAQGIEIGVSHRPQLEALAAAAARAGTTATLQFKIDTGLSRNGASPSEWDELFARGAELEREGLVRVRGIFSHLANAGREEDLEQGVRFDAAIAALRAAGSEPELIHLAASAGTFSHPELHYNAVRVGVVVYGLSPFADRSSADLGLIPAMTLKSEIVSLRDVTVGTGVSYGYNHIVQRDTTLALVPIGYADGMPRALNGAGVSVAIAGQHCPIVGRIGMDQCIIDVGDLGTRIELGEPVVLFGDPTLGVPPVEEWAELMGTINYEIIVGIGSRVLRLAADAETPSEAEAPREAAVSETSGGTSEAEASDLETAATDRATPEPPEADAAWQTTIADPDAMHELGRRLGAQLSAGDLVILTGALGAGKTTLTRGIGEGLGVRGPITSPTFVLARTHPSLCGGPPLVHVDAYRLADAAEADDLDLDFEGSVVVAEWGAGLIPQSESWLEIVIERPDGASVRSEDGFGQDGDPADLSAEPIEPRSVIFRGFGARWRELESLL